MGEYMKIFLSCRDEDGSKMAVAASALARAAVPLYTDWVREFMLTTDVSSDVRLLASSTPRIFLSAGMYSRSDGLPDCNDVDTYVLTPVITVGHETVGLVVANTGSGLDAVSVIGRYHFCHSSGAFLVLARALPHENDTHVAMVSFMRQMTGGSEVDPSEAMARRRKTHVVAWPAVRGRVGSELPLGAAVAEKLTAVVDSDLFEAGNYWQCIYSGVHQAAAERQSCADCLARELETTLSLAQPDVDGNLDLVGPPASHSSSAQSEPPPTRAPCSCRDKLLPAESAVQPNLCDRNLRLSLGGSWVGSSTCVSCMPGLPGPPTLQSAPFALTRAVSMSLQFVRDATVCAPLESLALTRAMALAFVPGVLPFTNGKMSSSVPLLTSDRQAACETPLALDPEFATAREEVSVCPNLASESSVRDSSEDILALTAIPPAVFEAAIGDAPLSKRERSLALAEARRQRNRQAAARSNARRKERNDTLRNALREARTLVLALRAREMELRSANVALRTRLEMSKTEGSRVEAS